MKRFRHTFMDFGLIAMLAGIALATFAMTQTGYISM